MIDDNTATTGPDPKADSSPAESADQSDAAEDATSPRLHDRRWFRRAVAASTVAIVLVALGLAGFLGWKLKDKSDIDTAGQDAMDTAKTYAVNLTSVDSNNLDQNFAAVLDGATGEFKDMYSQSSGQLKQLLIDNKAIGHGTVVDAGIKSATKDKVEVMLFVDQSVANNTTPDPRIDRSRIVMTMEHVDGRWLASKVDLL